MVRPKAIKKENGDDLYELIWSKFQDTFKLKMQSAKGHPWCPIKVS